MVLDGMRKILGQASENFAVEVLAQGGQDVNRIAAAALKETDRWHKRDCPLKPVLIVWLVVMLALYRNLSIPNVFKRMLALIQVAHPELRLNTITPEALHHARARMGAEPLRILFEELAQTTSWTKTFHGFRVIAGDGTLYRMPDTKANESKFGRRKGGRAPAAYPQLLAVSLVDSSTRKIVGVEFRACNSNEHEPLEVLVERLLGTGDLLLLDRGLVSFRVFRICLTLDVGFVGRIPATWKPKIIRRSGTGDALVQIKACKEERKRLREMGIDPEIGVELRMISYRVGDGETVRLLTSLVDTEQYSAEELGQLYHRRWEAELAFDELKTHLVSPGCGKPPIHFRSKNPDSVLQEAYGMFIGYNLLRQVMVRAATENDLDPLNLSFVDTLEVVKLWSPRLAALPYESRPLAVKVFLSEIAACRLRPRQKRRCPRKVKVKMSNYKRKRAEDVEELVDFAGEFELVDPAPEASIS